MKQLFALCTFLCIFGACSSGPQVTVCASNPPSAQFNCATKSGPAPSVTYAQAAAANYVVYAPQGEQSMLDYCANRNTAGIEPPQFARCSTDMSNQGFDCVDEICEVNGYENGLNCTSGQKSFYPFSASLNYLAFSAADNQTLLDYCNISIQN